MTARSPISLALLLAAVLAAGGCDSSFEPYAQTDRQFSVFGLLNPSDQRHRVRVEPLQDGQPFDTDSTLDATVTLTHLGSGQEATLEKEILSFRGIKLNYVTDDIDLELDERYRLTVQRPSREATTATFQTPHEVPELSLSDQGLQATIENGTDDRLFFLRVEYTVGISTESGIYEDTFTVQYAQKATRTATGYAASFDWAADMASLLGRGNGWSVELRRVDVQVSLAHPSAPTYEGLTYEELFSPEVSPTNVENGYGYVASITFDSATVTPFPRPQITL